MPQIIEKKDTAITRGIKDVGVGKKGSKPLTLALAQEISADIQSKNIPPAALGAFLGALILKGVTPDEKILEKVIFPDALSKPKEIIEFFSSESPAFAKETCRQLLTGEVLDKQNALKFGDFLFSNEPGDFLRGLAASVFRVRYETTDEYSGLIESAVKTLEKPFQDPVACDEPIIQMAEPFDGVDHSNMITPLVGDYLQKLNFRVVHLVGRNSGPKLIYNLAEIAKQIDGTFLKSNQDITRSKQTFGFFLHQKDLSQALDRWVDIRRQTIKRPFLSTIERFIGPMKPFIHIASAFHPPYGEKMIQICENLQLPAAIIVRNGMEGTIALPLLRPAKILASVRQSDGTYLRKEFEFVTDQFLKEKFDIEEKNVNLSLDGNVRLIKEYQSNGKTGNRHFDARVKFTCACLAEVINFVKNNCEA